MGYLRLQRLVDSWDLEWVPYLWNVPIAVLALSIALYLPYLVDASPPVALGWVAIALGAVCFYLRANPRARQILRLGRVGLPMRWIAAAVAADLVCEGSLLLLWRRFAGPQPHDSNPLEPYMGGIAGWTAVVVLLMVAIPLLEEAGWRGFLQGRLERRVGAGAAILVSALTFGLLHFDWWALPLLLVSGVILGYAAYRSASIWVGFAMHASWNGCMLLLDAAELVADPLPGLSSGELVLAAMISGTLLFWVLRKIVPVHVSGPGRGAIFEAAKGQPA